ncbi:MAG: DUF2071 domain-containing protein [Opitutaceae bacterium]|nr:DUF2071 domain-containing protein [Opitutaceae bacterium]
MSPALPASDDPVRPPRNVSRGQKAAAAVGRQRWNYLLFAHWRVDPSAVQATLPAGLSVDTHCGAAFVGIVPFAMECVRPVGLPPLPWLSWFLELNVRTYVRDANGRRGVWFYSLDCNQPLAVAIARRFFHLPYFHARMSTQFRGATIAYACRRRHVSSPLCRYVWTPGRSADPAAPGSLAHFLVERYLLFTTDPAGRLLEGRVEHEPYRVHTPEVAEFSCEPGRQAGFTLEGAPVSLLGAEPVDVTIFPLQPVSTLRS